jgi:GSH-dependent disulfide-bond oxidoreductase
MIELFGMSSPNVRKVGIMLEELGVEYTLRHIAVFRGEQFEPAFVAMNPLGKVPVLFDHVHAPETPLFESGAILFYLAETYGAFLPQGGSGRYEVMAWLMVQMSAIGPMFGQYNHFQILGQQADRYAAARYQSQSERLYQLLERRLATHTWIAADAYSIADMAIYPWSLYLEKHGFDPARHPALLRWRDTVGGRDAVKRSWARFAAAFNQASDSSRKAATPQDLDRFFGREPGHPPADYSAVLRPGPVTPADAGTSMAAVTANPSSSGSP